jgi:hypothetical protein
VTVELNNVVRDLNLFMMYEHQDLSFEYCPNSFFKGKKEMVILYCICRSAWIEGSTAKVIYGEKQKIFNMWH